MKAPRWIQVVMLAFPRPVRRRYGAEVLDLVDRRYRTQLRGAGWLRRAGFWLSTTADLLVSGLRIRRDLRARPPARRPARKQRGGSGWVMDLRQAFRLLVNQPVFSAVVIITLGLGIGANAALFAVVKGVLLAPLPYPDPDGVVRIWEHDLNEGRVHGNLSPADYFNYKEQVGSLEAVGAFVPTAAVLQTESGAERVPVQLFTPDVFAVLGVPPILGRTFTATDVREGRRVTVISHGYWQRRFGGDSSVVGSLLTTTGGSYEIVGVMPERFRPFGGAAELWASWDLSDDRDRRAVHFIRAVARVAAGSTVDDVRRDLLAVARRLETAYPEINGGHLVTVETITEATVGEVRRGLVLLTAAVGLVLLIACANLANLFLSRSVARTRELAVRAALGAGRGRLTRHLATENLVLSGLGGLLGLAVAAAAVRAVVAWNPGTLPRLDNVQLDPVIVGFTMVIAIVSGLLFGVGPAAVVVRHDLHSTLRAGGRWAAGGAGRRARAALVMTQLALAVLLLSGAGLLGRSFAALTRVDPGFAAEQLITASLDLPDSGYDDGAIVQFQRRLAERLGQGDQILRVGTVTFLPFTGNSATAWINIVGRPPWPGTPPEVNIINVSGDYFRAMGVQLLAGRGFDERDQAESPPVTVVNRALVEEHFADEDPIGQRIRLGPNPEAEPLEIIGVVSDMRQYRLEEEPMPAAFTTSAQGAWSSFTVVAQTRGDPVRAAVVLRTAAGELDPNVAVFDVAPMSGLIGESVARPRFSMALLAVFAVVALVIAAVGVYGVIAYSVSQRLREMGIRIALGAEVGRVRRLVVQRGLALVVPGVLLGTLGAAAGARFLGTMLYGIPPRDPITFVAVPMVLTVVAMVACLVPAVRAGAVDPAVALRDE